MAKTSIYLPDGLADKARQHDINLSQIAAEAIAAALEQTSQRCARCGQPITTDPPTERGR